MEKNQNTLKTLIELAYKDSKPRRLNQVISLIYGRAELRHGTLTKPDLDKLNKLSQQVEDLPTCFSVGLIYNFIFGFHLANVENYDPDFILTLTNILFSLYEKLSGTILSRRILIHLKKLLLNLIKRPELQQEDRLQIHSLLENPSIRMDNIFSNFDENPVIKEIKQLLKAKHGLPKVTALTNLMNLITECSSLEEQLNVFYKKVLVILKAGNINTNDHPKELLHLLSYLIDHMFFQCEYLIKINRQVFDPSKDATTDPAIFLNFETEPIIVKPKERVIEADEGPDRNYFVVTYRLVEPEILLKLSENIYPILAFFINTFLLYPNQIEIQRLSIILLQRLYYTFPKFRKNIEDAVMSILAFINADSLDSNKKEASVFLYKLINKDASPEFKQNLLSKDSFKTLYETQFYRPCVINKAENIIEAINLKDLTIKAGFPQIKVIPAGTAHTIFIEIWKPYSILHWAFALADYDIVFSLIQVSSFGKTIREQKSEPEAVYKAKKIEASKHHYKGSLIIKDAGLYKLTFDNSGSWFNSKTIKLVVHILEPDMDVGIVVPGHEHVSVMEQQRQEEPEERETQTEHPRNASRKSSNIYESQELTEATALIHLDKYNINFKVGTKHKSYELQFKYPQSEAEWENINKEMLEITKKGIKKEESQSEYHFVVKFVYNRDTLKNKFFKDENISKSSIVKKLNLSFRFLDPLQDLILDEIQAYSDTDYILREIVSSSHEENIYVVCIDNLSKVFTGVSGRPNKELNSGALNEICIPMFKEGEFAMENLNTLYFSEESPNNKLYYLTCLIVNIYELHEKKIKNIIIFEDKPSDYLIEGQNNIKEMFSEYILKAQKKREDLSGEASLEKDEVPGLDFRRVRAEEFLNI